MMRILLIVGLLVGPAIAQLDEAPKANSVVAKKILLLPIKNTSKYRKYSDLDIHIALWRSLADSLKLNPLFALVEPDSVAMEGLSDKERKGNIGTDRALVLGHHAGADFVVLGTVEAFGINKTSGYVVEAEYPLKSSSGAKAKHEPEYKGLATINLEIFRVSDGLIVGQIRQAGIKEANLNGINKIPPFQEFFGSSLPPWGSEDFHQTMLGGAIDQCLGKLAADLATLLRPLPAP